MSDTFTVSVTIEELDNGNVSSVVDEVPAHLADHWSVFDIAQWAVERDDAVCGMACRWDENYEPVAFGEYGQSSAYYIRVGARHLATVAVIIQDRMYKVTYPDGEAALYADENMAALAADMSDGLLDVALVTV